MSNRIILSTFHAEELALVGGTRKQLDGSAAGRLADGCGQGERLTLTITAGASPVYLGGPNVAVGTIPTIPAGGQISMDAGNLGVWAISSANTTVAILEGF